MKKYLKPKKQERLTNPFTIKEGGQKSKKLQTVYRSDWSEDVYISEKEQKETVGRNFNFAKLSVISVVFIFFISVILAKTAWLQIVRGDYYYSTILWGINISKE